MDLVEVLQRSHLRQPHHLDVTPELVRDETGGQVADVLPVLTLWYQYGLQFDVVALTHHLVKVHVPLLDSHLPQPDVAGVE